MNRTLDKLALTFAIFATLLCIVSIAPALLCLVLAIVAFVMVLFGVVVFLVGGLFGLIFAAFDRSLLDGSMALAKGSFSWAGGIFKIVEPTSRFCLHYSSPVTAGIAIACAFLGLVLASIALKRTAKYNAQLIAEGKEKVGAKAAKTGLGLSISFGVLSFVMLVVSLAVYFLVFANA